MSWRDHKTVKSSLTEERERKRKKLEEEQKERLLRAQERAKRQNQLQKALESQREADQALKDFLAIDPELFQGEEEIEENFDISDFLEDKIVMANFDELDADNGADAIKSLGQIKVNWDGENPKYFFQKLETELQIFSINKQFTKRQALIRCLPDEVAKEFMHLVTLQETEAGTQSYKTLKTALVKAYGPRPGDAFQKAMNRVMVGKPSVLLKLLVSDICTKNLVDCCCKTTVWGLFQDKIPMYLKNGLANEVFDSTNMHEIMDRADNLWAANQSEKQVSSVSQEKTKESDAEIAAVGRGRGGFRPFRARGNRGSRGNGRGARGAQSNGGQNKPDPRGQRHSSNPPWNSCTAHWLHAEGAWKCQAPTTCPMKDKVTPRT